MKVILQKDIHNLGDAGDVKEVADGYARNYLIPKNLVIRANESSKKAAEHQKKLIRLKKEKRRKESEKLNAALSEVSLVIKAKVGEEGKLFGSITNMHIAKNLSDLGFNIDKKKIHLENPIKQEGEYEIPVRLDDGITAKIKLMVEKSE